MPKGSFTPFTDADKETILREYLNMPTKRLAKEIGCSDARIHRFLKTQGLEVPKEKKAKWVAQSRLQKGLVPPNKGKKMEEFLAPEHIARWRKNQFQTGHAPHNTKYNGAISKRGDKSGATYQYIRLAKGKWRALHVHLWEQHHGKVPKGHVVAFKDGNTLHAALENLELVSRAALMARNTIHNYPQELKNSLRLIKKINSQFTKNN